MSKLYKIQKDKEYLKFPNYTEFKRIKNIYPNFPNFTKFERITKIYPNLINTKG